MRKLEKKIDEYQSGPIMEPSNKAIDVAETCYTSLVRVRVRVRVRVNSQIGLRLVLISR